MPANIKLLAVPFFCAVLLAGAQEPKINSIEPAAIAPGKTTRITLQGDNVETNATLWASFPCDIAGPEITLPPDAPVGVGVVRAINSKGVSGFHLLMIDDLPSIKESSSNQTVTAAQSIKPPIAIDGACNDVNFDFYTFQARKGQEFSIEAVAQRLGSQADTVIRVIDQKGHEYAFSDDGPGVGRDSRFVFKAPASGTYLLEVRDINYQGGAQYRYRLRIGSFPLLTVAYPPVVAGGKTTKVRLETQERGIQAVCSEARIPLSVRGKAGSGFTSVFVSDLDEALEKEPNDTIEQATPITQSVCGRFDKEKDRDLFRFEADKDQRLLIAARTRSLGSACDVLLNILKSDGSKVLEANVTGADEGTITNTFKEAGTYFAEVQELTESASPDFIYRLTVSPLPSSGLELSTEQDRWEANKEGHFTLKVSVTRRQFDGPVTLSLVGDHDVTLEDNTIPEKKNETTLNLKPGKDFPRAKLLHLRLQGQAKVGDSTITIPVSTVPALRKQWSRLAILPLELDGFVALLVP